MINLILGTTVLDGDALDAENARKLINHSNAINDFLKKLEESTNPKK